MKSKIGLIIRREYLTKVRRKSFIVMTILGPLLFVGVFAAIAFLANANKSVKLIAVYDQSALFTNSLESTEEIKFSFVENNNLDGAIDKVSTGEYFALVQIPPLQDNSLEKLAVGIKFYCNETPPISLESNISKQLESKLRELKLIELGTSSATVKSANIEVKLNQLDDLGDEKNSRLTYIKVAIAAICGFLIYMFIFIYGVQVMRSIIEEKTNRIVEIIISSVRPFQLMMGKIIGSAAVGLTQFLLWLILSFGLTTIATSFMGINFNRSQMANYPVEAKNEKLVEILELIGQIDLGLIFAAFVFFFLGGYLLYSALFAAIGSAVDSETDTQQFMLPITLPLIIAIYSGFMIIENPHGPVAFWMSMIPLTSPVVMMARIPFEVPIWQLVLSGVLLVLGFVFTSFVAAKIYKTGVLMHGKKPSYKEIWKWLWY